MNCGNESLGKWIRSSYLKDFTNKFMTLVSTAKSLMFQLLDFKERKTNALQNEREDH